MSRYVLAPLLNKLEATFALTNDEIAAVTSLPIRIKDFAKGEVLIGEGARPTQSFVIISGVSFMFKTSREGRRQILIFHFPGDCPDLQSLHVNELDMSVGAISRTKVAFIQHQDIRLLYARFPRVGEALWRMSLLDAAILRERMLNLGQRQAPERLAHLFCELAVRMELAGQDQDGSVVLPLTQQDIGDALGLTNIHVNRITRELKERGLVEMKRGKIIVKNWRNLQEAADFDTTYLHLTPAQRLLLAR